MCVVYAAHIKQAISISYGNSYCQYEMTVCLLIEGRFFNLGNVLYDDFNGLCAVFV